MHLSEVSLLAASRALSEQRGQVLCLSSSFRSSKRAPAQRALLNFTRISLEFSEVHQNFTRISPEFHWNLLEFPVPFGRVPCIWALPTSNSHDSGVDLAAGACAENYRSGAPESQVDHKDIPKRGLLGVGGPHPHGSALYLRSLSLSALRISGA